MIKKIFYFVTVLMMALSFSACSFNIGGGTGGSTGVGDFAAFQELQKNMENIQDAEFKMNMDIGMAIMGDVSTKLSGKQVKNGDSFDMAMDLTMNMQGADLSGKMYMKDDMIYTDMMGMKVKMSAKDNSAQMVNTDFGSMLDMDKDMVSDFKAKKEGSDTVYTFSINADSALDYFKKTAGSSAGSMESFSDIDFSKMDFKVVADKDNMMKSMTLDSAMSVKAAGETIDMSYKINMEYKSINTGLKIEFPDFSGYIESPVM